MEEETDLLGESLVEGKRRVSFRNPRLRMALVTNVRTIDFATILCMYIQSEFEKVQYSVTTPHLSDHNLVARVQAAVAGRVWECNTSPCDFERTRGPNVRAGIEYSRNWDSEGYLGIIRSCIPDQCFHGAYLTGPHFVHGFCLLNP